MSNLLGKLLAGRYQLTEVIARGGMATVYLGRDQKLDRPVAVKVIHQHLSEDPEFRDKFFREARMLAKVSHSNLVNIYDQGDDQGNAFIVLELVQGITLRQALTDFGRLEPEQIHQVSKAILSALAQAHSSGIVHRDLKPENVILADDGRIKVTDFGLARELSNDTDTGSLVGTVAYLAPEVIRRGKTETASDIYSFGIMLFEMLTGSQPFRGDDAMQVAFMHTSQRVPSAKSVLPNVSEKLDELMIWCTQPAVSNRPQNAQQVLDWLDTVSDLPDISKTIKLPENTNFTEVIGDLEPETEPFTKHTSRRPITKWFIGSVLALSLGSSLGWWFGLGPGALIAVPNVSDKSQSQATGILSEITDEITITEVFSDSFAEGTVVGTEPGAGMLVARGSGITLLISKGKELVAVPNIIGKDLATATAQLVGARLSLGSVGQWFNSEYPIGVVYAYTGSDGRKLPVTSPVDVKVSLGAIPLVVGLQEAIAKAALEAAGLEVRVVEYQYSSSVAKGLVISVVPDEPEIGQGSSLKLVVSKGAETVKMPKVRGETILAAKSLLESLGLKVVIDTKWLTKDYGIKRVTGASEAQGSTLKVGQTVIIRSR
ncbi:MAG: protein kinase [Acidobacteria bacterium]|nr:protein kinase [Acidobacteriota bacterium]